MFDEKKGNALTQPSNCKLENFQTNALCHQHNGTLMWITATKLVKITVKEICFIYREKKSKT